MELGNVDVADQMFAIWLMVSARCHSKSSQVLAVRLKIMSKGTYYPHPFETFLDRRKSWVSLGVWLHEN